MSGNCVCAIVKIPASCAGPWGSDRQSAPLRWEERELGYATNPADSGLAQLMVGIRLRLPSLFDELRAEAEAVADGNEVAAAGQKGEAVRSSVG